MALELLVLGCTGVVIFLHGANFFFHALWQHFTVRSLRHFPLFLKTSLYGSFGDSTTKFDDPLNLTSWARLDDRNWRRRAVDHLFGDEQQQIED
ncbi:hypothetical protein SDJN02_04336 [Cucurbita argyrosperma subsp. argyrosperma]|nr:hypothetical protein SDJN02_04336 [Cucurbita argyrosperma subsp. argyrosperma]